MHKVIFCEVAWMKYYAGADEEDQPRHGGKYIDANGEGGEIYNFSPYNHYCYGYVMHYGSELHLERYGGQGRDSPELTDVTVVWVASDGRASKIVGWYEHATVYRDWQCLYDTQYFDNGEQDYNVKAHETDCYLIDEEEREFIIPRASVAGKGRGMGQSQIWYADSPYAQEILIPEVLAYLDSKREVCNPVYLMAEELEAVASDEGLSPEELRKMADQLFEENDVLGAIAYMNLAIARDDSYENRYLRGDIFAAIAFYDEAEEDYKRAILFRETIEALSALFYAAWILQHDFLALEIGEKLRERKEEDAWWKDDAKNLVYGYLIVGETDKAVEVLNECEKDKEKYRYEFLEDAWNKVNEIRKGKKEGGY